MTLLINCTQLFHSGTLGAPYFSASIPALQCFSSRCRQQKAQLLLLCWCLRLHRDSCCQRFCCFKAGWFTAHTRLTIGACSVRLLRCRCLDRGPGGFLSRPCAPVCAYVCAVSDGNPWIDGGGGYCYQPGGLFCCSCTFSRECPKQTER